MIHDLCFYNSKAGVLFMGRSMNQYRKHMENQYKNRIENRYPKCDLKVIADVIKYIYDDE